MPESALAAAPEVRGREGVSLLKTLWEVVVVGAGPAGAVAAKMLASKGLSVLLVDRAAFPRSKVCGCCLNAAALHELVLAGLGDIPKQLGGKPLNSLRLCYNGRTADVALPSGVALSRQAFDADLVHRAEYAGATFLGHTAAAIGSLKTDYREVLLRAGSKQLQVQARVVLVAHGLGGKSLPARGFRRLVARRSRMGAGTALPETPDWISAGTIYMVCGSGGYVGLVRLEDGQLNVASALDQPFVRTTGGPGEAVRQLLREAGLPALPDMNNAAWHGTPWLTSASSHLAAGRLFLIGDAAGYVEPFTGEGIAWALASANAVSDLVVEGVDGWSSDLERRWSRMHRQLFARRQRFCRMVAFALRRPSLLSAAAPVIQRCPWLLSPLVLHTNSLLH